MAECWFFKSFLLFFFFFFLFPHFASPLSDSEALLQLKQHFNSATPALDSWVSGSPPCDEKTPWRGLYCFKGVVMGLRLEGMGLSGDIDVDALREMKGLRFISLMNNSFQGDIPELNRLTSLKGLFMSGNQFSGDISPYFFSKMEFLKQVWLSYNNFTGSIPLSLGQLPRLIELRLNDNQFSGHIPTFLYSHLGFIDVSNNNLEGEIPTSLSQFNKSSFEGNPHLCGQKVLGVECVKPIEASSPNQNINGIKPRKKLPKMTVALIIMLVMLFIVIILVILGIIGWMRSKKKGSGSNSRTNVPSSSTGTRNDQSVEVKVTVPSTREMEPGKRSNASSSSKVGGGGGGGGGGGRGSDATKLIMVNDKKGVFGLPELMKGTAEVLGNGGLGSSYKVIMANGVGLVVKKMKDMNALGKDEFEKLIKRLGKLQHTNVLTPLACRYKREEKLFVYEYIRDGSLLYKLHGDHDENAKADELDWPTRLMIVQGIARGLDYLHMEITSHDVPHGNLKSSNILLGPDNHPIVSDYGFGPLVNAEAIEALFAYKSPDAINGKVSPKTDVYCLGIVILEILTGQFPSQYLTNGEGGTDVVQWAASSFSEGRLVELIDPAIAGNGNVGNMERLLQIGLLCTESSPEIRLAMKDALKMIEEIQV